MNDVVVLFGLELFPLSVRTFVLALGLSIFAYERAEARARRRGDARWLLVSLVFATVAAFAIELEPKDGFGGVAGLTIEATLGVAWVGLGEVALLLWELARGRVERGHAAASPVLPALR